MADLPQILARPGLPTLELPRATPNQFGAGAWAAFGDIGTALEHVAKQESPIEAATLKAKYDEAMDSARSQLGQENEDPTTWPDAMKKAEAKIRADVIAGSKDPNAVKHFQLHATDQAARYQILVNHDSIKSRQDNAIAKLDDAESAVIRKVSETDDPIEVKKAVNEHLGLIKSQAVSGPFSIFSQKQATDRALLFDKKVAIAQVDRMISKNPVLAVNAINAGQFNERLDPQTLLTLQTRAEGRATANQNAMDKQVKQLQENNRDNLVREAISGADPAAQRSRINTAFQDRQITIEGRDKALQELDALTTSAGVTASDRRVYESLEYRGRFGGIVPGVALPSPQEIASQAAAGKLSRPDKDHLDTILSEALQRKNDANDVSKDPHYQRGMNAIRTTLPSSDRLDLSQETRMIVGNAQTEFDKAMRDPKYGPAKADQVSQSIIDTAMARMGKSEDGLRVKLYPGIQTPQDVGTAVRSGRMTPAQATEQLRIIQQLQELQKIRPSKSSNPASRDEAARRQQQGQ